MSEASQGNCSRSILAVGTTVSFADLGARTSSSAPFVREIDGEDLLIDSIARQLAQLGRAATVRLALDVGKIVCEALMRSPDRQTNLRSFRKLAAHPAVPYGVGTLWRSAAIYQLSVASPHLFSLQNLGVSHYRAVLNLPAEIQERLLVRASEEGWTKAEIEAAASTARHASGRLGKRGRPGALRSIERLERLVLSQAREARSHWVMDDNDLEAFVDAVQRINTALNATLETLTKRFGARS